jgi:hypothetical protein
MNARFCHHSAVSWRFFQKKLLLISCPLRSESFKHPRTISGLRVSNIPVPYHMAAALPERKIVGPEATIRLHGVSKRALPTASRNPLSAISVALCAYSPSRVLNRGPGRDREGLGRGGSQRLLRDTTGSARRIFNDSGSFRRRQGTCTLACWDWKHHSHILCPSTID